MSDDKNRNALADMELEDNFFDKNARAEEEAFQQEFDDPYVFDNTGIDTGTGDEGIEGTEVAEGTEGAQAGADEDPFKFDDALAEEEARELAELNAKLGSNFKDRNELNEALKKAEQSDRNNEIEENKKYINYFNQLLDRERYPDDVLVKEDKRLAAIRDGKDIKDPEVLDQIDYEVNQLAESGGLNYAARAIRQELMVNLKEKEKVVQEYENTQRLTLEQQQQKYKRDLQEGIDEIYRAGKFLGIQPTKEDMLDVYKDISKNKHLEHLKAHPKDAVEFALFKKYKNIIVKNLGKPNYEAGVKRTLEELGMSRSSQTGTQGNDNTRGNDAEELTFLQRFAK